MTAVLLAEAGIEVRIIDREYRTAARSYACALHPHTLGLLAKLGLASSLIDAGRKLETVAFYEQSERCAELNLAKLGGDFPFLLVTPQSALESALENKLLTQFGIRVLWNHRFDDLEPAADALHVTLEELEGTTTGYIVPHWELEVKRRLALHCNYVVGTDGANSLVRRRLGIDLVSVARPQFFAAYEFEPAGEVPMDLRVALNPDNTSVLWPLPGNRCRWTFQMPPADAREDFPEKERRSGRVAQTKIDENIKSYVEQVAKERAPWFSARIKEITWCTRVMFEPRHAAEFGVGNCVLAGDAAHQTGPVGGQSMNAGFQEAAELTSIFTRILHQNAHPDLLTAYRAEQKTRWQSLLGIHGGLKAREAATPWIKKNCTRLLPCIPGTGADLARLAGQLHLDFSGGETPATGTN